MRSGGPVTDRPSRKMSDLLLDVHTDTFADEGSGVGAREVDAVRDDAGFDHQIVEVLNGFIRDDAAR